MALLSIHIHIQRKGLFILLRLSRCRSSIAFRLFIPMKTRGEELLFPPSLSLPEQKDNDQRTKTTHRERKEEISHIYYY